MFLPTKANRTSELTEELIDILFNIWNISNNNIKENKSTIIILYNSVLVRLQEYYRINKKLLKYNRILYRTEFNIISTIAASTALANKLAIQTDNRINNKNTAIVTNRV